MALTDSTWYVNFGDGSTTGYYAITRRPQNAAVAAGQLVRQFTTPTVGNERVFVCIIAGTTANVTDATWVLTRGAKTTDGTATWMECSGQAALNGDLTNTKTWTEVKAATPAVLGQVLKRSNNASYQICTTAGAMSASEPSFSDTAGTTTTDTTAVWTSLGPVSNFTGGQAPHARLANALASTWFASGNTVYVGDNHAETQASAITMSPASALLAKILCHNRSGSYPPTVGDITTGATITATGVSVLTFAAQGSFYFYGVSFVGNSGVTLGPSAVGQVQNWYYFDSCAFKVIAATAPIVVGATSTAWGVVTWNNCVVNFSVTSNLIIPSFSQFVWQNTGQILSVGSVVPTILLGSNSSNQRFNNVVLNSLDLSQITASLFGPAQASIGTLVVQDCKLNAAMTVTTPINTGMNVQMIRSDSAGTSYKSTRYNYEGTETTETSIVRTGGAVDPTGQAQSRKIVTSANAQWLRPFRAEPMAIWNPTTGANVTATVYGTVNAGALPNNDDIWLECEYLGSATDPLGKIVTTTKASVLASNAAVSADLSSWGGGGSGAGWSPFKLTATLSSPQPQLAGYLHARVRAAKASMTVYIDPQVTLT